MRVPQIVIDTNVLASGLRSRRGWSHRLLQLVNTGHFKINLSVPLVLEYEEILFDMEPELPVSSEVIRDVIDFHGVEEFALQVLTPGEFLRQIGVSPEDTQ